MADMPLDSIPEKPDMAAPDNQTRSTQVQCTCPSHSHQHLANAGCDSAQCRPFFSAK